jgi:predicted HAD superfamily Cof-like phosphohydrolase
MKQILDSVAEFHDAFGVMNGSIPNIATPSICELRYKLMAEENDEYIEACEKHDLVGMADALGDMMYILAGTMLVHGMQGKIQQVFDEIHRSNMSKLGEDGKPLYREDGKIMKGPGYFKPDIQSLLIK